MTGELTGNVAVITGGSRGIGRSIAQALAAQGSDCLLVSRTASDLAETAKQINADTGARVEVCAVDLTTEAGCEEVLATAQSAFGRASILINNAGDTKGGAFLELDDEVWHAGFDLKFWSAVRLSRLLWPMLTESKGTVINIGGGFARTPSPDVLIGGAVNAALANFTKGLAGVGLKDDVSVNAVHPGPTLTERMTNMFEARGAQAGITADEFKQRLIDKQGVRRLGEPEDVAAVVAFLCSPAARHIQGVSIAVDGGGTQGLF
ncbi:MAG: SDR family oxidoreductase [Acidimicrobiia bacterium]|nr:SDR family oxidoreductase [Acidimicrobiia bacterium]